MEAAMLLNIRITLVVLIVVTALGCGGGSRPAPHTQNGDPSNSPGQGNTVGPISISPAADTLRIGGQRQFSGWDSTVGQYDVTWSLQEGAAAGSLTADGLYTAPSTPGTFHLVATSSHNPNLSATAPVTVVATGFVPVSDMSIARAGHTATLLADGRVLVVGGTADIAHSAEIFVPASSTFIAASTMVHVRSGHCASLLVNGRILITGGVDADRALIKTAEIFDPTTRSFTTAADLNQARQGASCTSLPNGTVLIAGGHDSSGGSVLTAELYNPTTGNFQPVGSMHSPRAGHAGIRLPSGKVLLVGGDDESSSAELFDPASGLFTTTGSMSQPRAHASATLLPNGKVLVLGGTHTIPPEGGGAAPAPVSIGSAEIYDPAAGTFHGAGKLLVARDSHSATLLANGTVLVAGGYWHGFDGDADSEWFTIFTAEIFDPNTLASSFAASLEVDRAEHVATELSDGKVLITGGIKGFQELCCKPKPYTVALTSSEIYQ
jgi:hypothetical protein